VKCAVAGSLIATGVWLASRVYVCMHLGKVALWLVIDPCVNFVDVCIVIFGMYF
jgi:hypothetical protein